MIESLLGTIRGNTIELQTPSGFAEGMLVEVVVRTVAQYDIESIRRGSNKLQEENLKDLETSIQQMKAGLGIDAKQVFDEARKLILGK